MSASSDGLRTGSTFEIRLPLVDRGHEPAVELAQSKVPARRILVVDDNKDAANSLAMILTLEGHQVESVYTAHEALARVLSFKPEVALLDIGLPEMNGYELARRLRDQPEAREIRLVALTGYGQAEDKERAWAAGFDDHLAKPADLRALQRTLAATSAKNSR